MEETTSGPAEELAGGTLWIDPPDNGDDEVQIRATSENPPQFQFIDLSTTSTEERSRNRTMARSHATKVAHRERKRPELQYQFIDLSEASTKQQKENRTIARSHVMKLVRRGQRERQLLLRRVEESSSRRVTPEQMSVSSSSSPLPSTLEQHQQSATILAQLFSNSTWAMNSLRLSQRPMLESTINALETYTEKVTPHMHYLFGHLASVQWSLFWKPKTAYDLSPLAVDWFSLVRSYPVLFHASLWASALILDMIYYSTTLRSTPEIRLHKLEAIRLLKEAVATGVDVPEAAILAILCLMREDVDTDEPEVVPQELEDSYSPFKLPLLPALWQRHLRFVNVDETHMSGANALVRMKGGIGKLRERCVAMAMSHRYLVGAAWTLTKPEVEFWDMPEIMARAADPRTNVSVRPFDEHRGSNLSSLLAYGLTEEGLSVMADMLNVTWLVECYVEGALVSPDILALTCRKNHVHHRLLSLPTGDEVSVLLGSKAGFYECCRLAALMYSTAILYPMPRSTGIPQRLIAEIKKCIEQISMEVLFGGATAFFVWVLMLTGVAAAGLPERPWYEGKLVDLLTVEDVSRWSEVKKIVSSYLWMDSASDEAAMLLWDDIAPVLRRL